MRRVDRGVARQRWTALRGMARRNGRSMPATILRWAGTGTARRAARIQLRAVEATLGTDQANRMFWRIPFGDRSWSAVAVRLEALAGDSVALDDFVVASLEHCSDPAMVVAFARHPRSADAVRTWITHEVDTGFAGCQGRLRTNRLLGAAVAAAARLLLDSGPAASAVDAVIQLYQIPDERFFQFVDSAGWSPTQDSPTGGASPVRHRLVIAEHFRDLEAIALLLPGAERVTVLATTETFGRADFSDYRTWPGVGDVSVEHVRSRATRYSPDYIALHEETAALARELSRSVAEQIPEILAASDVPVLAVEIADFLFFQALKRRAVELALADDGFDHVIIATGEHFRRSEFLNLLGSIDGIFDDERVEVVSTSWSATARSRFWETVGELRAPSRPLKDSSFVVPRSVVLTMFDDDMRRLAGALGRFPVDGTHRVAVCTTWNAAYTESAAAYIAQLGREFDTRVIHIGPNVAPIVEELAALDGEPPAIDMLAPSRDRFAPLAGLLACGLPTRRPDAGAVTPARASSEWAYRFGRRRLLREVIAPTIGRSRAIDHWFEAACAENRGPDAVVLVAQRNMGVGGVAPIARRHSVPTVTLEPHAHDANYSRYLKIVADYYGVMSDHFRTQAIDGLGTSDDRTFTVGSPRQIAPPGHDRPTARRSARARLASSTGLRFEPGVVYVSFFCQPSEWDHVGKIWAHLLDASEVSDCHLLLKTHPEESVSRTEQYLAIAAERGASNRVTLVDTDPATAVDASDLVATAYSAAGFDAVLRGTPVVCITDGDVRYPVDLPTIFGAPVAHSAEEFCEIIDRYRRDPDAFAEFAREFLRRERQFVDGPGERARALVRLAIDRGAAGVRPVDELPEWLFLDPPHPTFPV